MIPAIPWLPREAIRDGTLSVLLFECADQWAARWFGPSKIALVRMEAEPIRLGPSTDVARWETVQPGLSVAIDPNTQLTFARWMLNAANGPQRLNSADTDLLRGLGAACAENFLREAAGLLLVDQTVQTASAAPLDEDVLRFSISIGPARVLDLFVAERIATAARKAAIAKPPSPAPLGALSAAFASETIRLGIKLGSAQIGLSEIGALAVGDVIVLDHGPSDSLPLTLNEDVQEHTSCRLHPDGMNFKFSVTSFEHGGVQ